MNKINIYNKFNVINYKLYTKKYKRKGKIMEEKKQIKISLGTAICIFIIVILIVALGGMWYYYNFINKEENSNKVVGNNISNNIGENNISKIDESKQLVYDAEYTYGDLEGKTYISKSMEKTYSLEDIVVPYININSDDAIKANKEIQQLFEECAEFFKQELEGEQTWYNIANYKTYSNDKILSILITVQSGGTDVENYEYYTYNFNLENLKMISYETAYNKAGFSSNNINSKVENAITNCEKLLNLTDSDCPEGTNRNTYINNSIKNYKDSIIDNSIKYFIDENGELNVIVKIEIPAGIGKFDTVILVKN